MTTILNMGNLYSMRLFALAVKISLVLGMAVMQIHSRRHTPKMITIRLLIMLVSS